MKLCLDACVALQMLLPDDNTDAALALQKEIRIQFHELIAPDTLPIEIAHVLTKAERQRKIDAGSAKGVLDGFLDYCPMLYPYFEYLDRAMELSSQFRLGVFDCLYVAVSEDQNCPIVTVDKRFLELFPNQTITPEDL